MRERPELSGSARAICPWELPEGPRWQSARAGGSWICLGLGRAVLAVRAQQHSVQTSSPQSVVPEPAASAPPRECVMNTNSWFPSQTYWIGNSGDEAQNLCFNKVILFRASLRTAGLNYSSTEIPVVSIYSFMDCFQQIHIEYLLCARHCSRLQEYRGEEGQSPSSG